MATVTVSAQTYLPPEGHSLWDSWLFADGDDYHLFFLERGPDHQWTTIGRAVSNDLVRWRPLPGIRIQGPAGSWDEKNPKTGTTVRHDGRYITFYGAGKGKEAQQIGLMSSSDLRHWEKHPGNPVLTAKPPYCGRDWRDLCTFYEPSEKLWHGYVCARTCEGEGVEPAPGRSPRGKGCIAHVTSKDLIEWQYLAPVFASDQFPFMEVPDYFELNGRHYLIFSCGGKRADTSGRINASGVFYVMADHRDGPYRVPKDYLLLGAGRGRYDNHVGRTIVINGKRLLYHIATGGKLPTVTWGTPKIVRQHADGTLWLQYWPGLKQLETGGLINSFKQVSGDGRTDPASWRVEGGCLVAEPSPAAQTLVWTGALGADVMITCTVRMNTAKRVGLVWRWDGKKGAALTLERTTGTAGLFEVTATETGLARKLLDDRVGLDISESPQHVRVFVRSFRAEVYVNDQWVFSAYLGDSPASGRIGLLVESGSATFSDLRIAELEPLHRPDVRMVGP